MLSHLLCSLLLLLSPHLVSVTETFKPTFFARIVVEKPTLVKGDSTLVSIILYSDGAFTEARCSNGELKLKNCSVRRIGNPRHRRTGQAILGNHRYNTLVWAQYVVASGKTGRIKIPPQKFKATLRYLQSDPSLPIDPWGRNAVYKDFTVKCSTKASVILYTEKPKKDTETLIRSGAHTI